MNFTLNKVQLDLLKRHLGPFVFCFFTIMFLLLMQFLILHIDKLVGKGLPFIIIVELILTNLAYMVVLAAPMAVLVSTLMAFGKFSELNELTALKAAGVNPIRVINPVLFSSVVLCLFLMWFSNDVLPDANQKARSLFIDIRIKKPGFDLQPKQFYRGIDGYTFLVNRVEPETDSLYDVTLFQEPSTQRQRAYIKAKRGLLKSEADKQTMTLYLYDGSILRYLRRAKTNEEFQEQNRFSRYRISFDLSELAFSRSNPEQRSRNDRTMSSKAMLTVVDSLRQIMTEEKKQAYERVKPWIPETGTSSGHNANQLRDLTHMEMMGDSANAPFESRYMALNLLPNKTMQTGIHQAAIAELRSIQSQIDNLVMENNWKKERIAQYWVEIHKKFSIPFACLVFVLVGAPIGMLTRKGNLGYAALIGTCFLTFYWITLIQGEKLADRLFITPFTGMWFTNIALCMVGTLLLLRLCTSFRFKQLWPRADDQKN